MKKVFGFIMVITFGLTLAGCVNEEPLKDDSNDKQVSDDVKEDVSFKVMAPIGTPALAQTYMEYSMPELDDYITYEIETVSGTDPLVAAFASGSHDIIYAPTNLGAKLISTGVDYKFAGTVVWGNLYLASTGYDDFKLSDLEGEEIIAFGQNATPDVVLQTVLDNYEFTTPPTIRYVDSVTTAQSELLMDNTAIILIAEPLLSVTGLPTKLGDTLDVIDLQQEWENVTGSSSYPMAGIFVKSDLDKEVVNLYLEQVALSVNKANEETASVAEMAVELEYGFPLPVLVSSIPRSNLEYKSALESKIALEEYFTYILELNGALIGGSLPGEEFYYSGE